MKTTKILAALSALLALPAAMAAVYPQCPFAYNATGGAQPAGVSAQTDAATGLTMYSRSVGSGADAHRQVCLHVVAGDGWMKMGDGRRLYGFGFAPARGVDEDVIINGTADARFSAPQLTFEQGDEVYLSLTNVGMILRPDLFDQHSVHWHGFPQASAVFDGVPQASITVNMGSTFTYYYKANDPGTYMYHCHVEATEHMEMGMLGTLHVRARQAPVQVSPTRTLTQFAYVDGDGSTGYDVDMPLQMGSVDSNFHDLHEAVQPLPFLELKSDYALLNGRGYPMTLIEHSAASPIDANPVLKIDLDDGSTRNSQRQTAQINARVGERILLRLSNLSVDNHFTLTALGLPLQVVGRGAAIARGPSGAAGDSWSHKTGSVTLGGGDGVDVLIDTTGIAPGTYFVYTTNLNFLSNGAAEDRGGLMTTIKLTATN